MKIKVIIITLISIIYSGCSEKLLPTAYKLISIPKKTLTAFQKNKWLHFDVKKDTIPGISLSRAHQEIIKDKIGSKVIIAVLDTETDINHIEIKGNIWINLEEIPNNNIDDDKNGYVDDIHGWNFLGNNNGENIINNSFESTRVINYFKEHPLKNHKDSLLYDKAKKMQNDLDNSFLENKKRIDFYKSSFPRCYNTIKQFFPNGKYTNQEIDSLFKVYQKKGDKILYYDLYLLNELKKLNLDSTWVVNNIKSFDIAEKTIYNNNYKEKDITKDDLYNTKDSIYGSNNLSKNAKATWHGTQVTGLIASTLLKQKNTSIKIMPIVISGEDGENCDKDILVAIKYAVNNGAKVINMSSGKELSLHPERLKEAVLYAAKNDVLIITSAGNKNKNMDEITKYLIDYDEETGQEFSNNLIKVGGISFNLNKNLLYNFSNYGKKNVDVFAPSEEIYVPDATEGYTFNSGTSLGSAITSGIAGLIRSYYPKLTAAQVKQIILDSGVSYNLQVQVPGEKEGVLKPFSELSKSGKVVNAYNALLMAEKMSKKKK
jgi:cell wall-associated protease